MNLEEITDAFVIKLIHPSSCWWFIWSRSPEEAEFGGRVCFFSHFNVDLCRWGDLCERELRITVCFDEKPLHPSFGQLRYRTQNKPTRSRLGCPSRLWRGVTPASTSVSWGTGWELWSRGGQRCRWLVSTETLFMTNAVVSVNSIRPPSQRSNRYRDDLFLLMFRDFGRGITI